jgi:His-Xaa-Ser system radical SAM maturase HxsB
MVKEKKSQKCNEYVIVNYRSKKINNDKFFVTNDEGSYIVLNNKKFDDFQSENIKGKLYDQLEESGFIITKKNQEEIVKKTREKYKFLFQGTSLHIIVPTLRCNLKCIYCQSSSVDAHLTKYDMNIETARKTVDFIFQTPSNFIVIEFQGGEPLLSFDIVKEITKYSREVNKKYKKELRILVVTNFNAIDEKKLNFLIKNKIDICTSLDGPKYVHDYNRPINKGTGSYDNVIKWLKRLKKEYKIKKVKNNINALITVTKKTLDYPKAVVDEYVKLEFKALQLRPVSNLGCANSDWEKLGYTPEEYIKFWKKSMDYIIQLNKKGTKIQERMTVIMLRKILNINKGSDYLDLRSPCGAAIGQLVYNHDGSIYTCDEGRMVGNNIFKIGTVNDKFKDVITSNQTCAIVASSINDCHICDNCVYKPYCGLCPVCNYHEQGNIIAKIPETPRCKIYMAMFNYITDKLFNDKETNKIFTEWAKKNIC